MAWWLIASGAFVGCTAAGAVGLAVLAWRARARGAPRDLTPPPAAVHVPVAELITREQVANALGELASVRAEWMAWKKQVETFLEEFDELAETIERRRGRIAASVAKRERQAAAEHPEGGNGTQPPTREELLRRARALGVPV